MFQFNHLTEADVARCAEAIANFGAEAASLEEAAQKIVRYFYDNLLAGSSRACALVRFYKAHPYGELEPQLQGFARSLLGDGEPSPALQCLTLLATAGDEPEWNSRERSAGHKAIPLPNAEAVGKIPMISRLLRQFGVDVEAVVHPDPAAIAKLREGAHHAFHVPAARNSPYIPAQEEFVKRFGIESVLGFGGVLDTGGLFAVILFSKVKIPRHVADAARPLEEAVREAVKELAREHVFAGAR